jgi:hypothetical protein
MKLVQDLMTEVWEEDKARTPDEAAKEIMARIQWHDRELVLLDLLAHEYSGFLSSQGPPKKVRRNAAQNPRRLREAVLADLDRRPFYIPSLKTRVLFANMTAAYWSEWADARRTRASGMLANATWAERNILALEEHGVKTSGELPEEVKRGLFDGTDAPDDE